MNNKKLTILILIVIIFVGIITFPGKKPVLNDDEPVLADTATHLNLLSQHMLRNMMLLPILF